MCAYKVFVYTCACAFAMCAHGVETKYEKVDYRCLQLEPTVQGGDF